MTTAAGVSSSESLRFTQAEQVKGTMNNLALSHDYVGWLADNRYLTLAMRLIVGGIFIFSSVSKLPNPNLFVNEVRSYGLLPDVLAVAYGLALPWIELLIGCYLVLGLLSRYAALGTILLSLSFAIANFVGILRGYEQCGSCFGESFPLRSPQALVIDFLLIAAALQVVLHKKDLLSLDSWMLKRKLS